MVEKLRMETVTVSEDMKTLPGRCEFLISFYARLLYDAYNKYVSFH